jgi:hypothetical protein
MAAWGQERRIGSVCALILSSTAGYAQTAYVYDLGAQSCEKYLAAVHGHPPGMGKSFNDRQGGRFSDDHSVYMAWLTGFFTATNLWVLEPNGIRSDSAAIDVWIRKWCEQNSTKTLREAASAFVWDQRQDYLNAFFARQAR